MTTATGIAARTRVSQQALADWLDSHWGMTLYRADPNAHGRFRGDWKTGWVVCGSHPGCGHGLIRYRSLAEIARIWKYPHDG